MAERVYIVVPRNLDVRRDGRMSKLSMTCGRAMGHAAHAAGMLGLEGVNVLPLDVIVLSVADLNELDLTRRALTCAQISFVEYEDEDRLYEGKLVTALATFPVEKSAAACLAHLRPWRCACNEGF